MAARISGQRTAEAQLGAMPLFAREVIKGCKDFLRGFEFNLLLVGLDLKNLDRNSTIRTRINFDFCKSSQLQFCLCLGSINSFI